MLEQCEVYKYVGINEVNCVKPSIKKEKGLYQNKSYIKNISKFRIEFIAANTLVIQVLICSLNIINCMLGKKKMDTYVQKVISYFGMHHQGPDIDLHRLSVNRKKKG